MTTVASGNWNDRTVWGGGVIPGRTDIAIITNGITVTGAPNVTCGSLEVQSGGTMDVSQNNFKVLGVTTVGDTLIHTSIKGNATFDGNVTIRTVESQKTTDKRITRCVKEGDLNSSIGVSAISSQWITVTAQETYTVGTWFKITVSQLPISDQAMKRYRATGAAAEKHVPVLEYQYKDCSGGYCDATGLTKTVQPFGDGHAQTLTRKQRIWARQVIV